MRAQDQHPALLTGDRDSWSRLNPGLRISDRPFARQSAAYVKDQALLDREDRHLLTEGFVRLEHVIPPKETRRLQEGVEALQRVGLPPIFCFVYDDYWVTLKRLKGILERFAGPGFLVLPDFWAWYVDHRSPGSGWSAHRDLRVPVTGKDSRPEILTVWIALTDATPDNACLYVLPLDLDPLYPHLLQKEFQPKLESARALPVRAGGMLLWHANLFHWSGRNGGYAAHPRISFAFSLQRQGREALYHPPIALEGRLTIDDRLVLIAAQFERYRHRFPSSPLLETFLKAFGERSWQSGR